MSQVLKITDGNKVSSLSSYMYLDVQLFANQIQNRFCKKV